MTINDLKIGVFYFPQKDSESTKNLQNFDSKADTVRQIMKIWEAFHFLKFRPQNVEFQTKKKLNQNFTVKKLCRPNKSYTKK